MYYKFPFFYFVYFDGCLSDYNRESQGRLYIIQSDLQYTSWHCWWALNRYILTQLLTQKNGNGAAQTEASSVLALFRFEGHFQCCVLGEWICGLQGTADSTIITWRKYATLFAHHIKKLLITSLWLIISQLLCALI